MAPIGTRLSVEKQPPRTMAIFPPTSLTSMSNGNTNGEGITAEVTGIAGPPLEEGIGSEDDDGDGDDDPIAQGDRRSREPSDFQPGSEGTSESDDEGMSEIDGDQVLGAIITPVTSLDSVRCLARMRVYNLTYLHPSRAFGPFLPIGNCFLRPNCSTRFFAEGRKTREQREANRRPVFLPCRRSQTIPFP